MKILKIESLPKWIGIDNALRVYTITQLKCASGLMVDAKVLHWHVGGKIKAQMLEDGNVIDDGFKYT